MPLEFLSRWLDQATQPRHPLYHPVQVVMFAGLSYISTACFTSIPPSKGMTFVILAYTISQFTASLFSKLLDPYQDIALVPLIGQVVHLSVALISAKVICQLIGQSLSFKEIRKMSIVFIMTLFVMRFALRKFRQQLQVR